MCSILTVVKISVFYGHVFFLLIQVNFDGIVDEEVDVDKDEKVGD